MKIYFTYFLASLSIAWIIIFQLGFSAGFSSIIPILALFGTIILFVLVIPYFVYNNKVGSYIALVGCLLMLPYVFSFTYGIISDIIARVKIHYIIILMFIPSILVLLAVYFSIKRIIDREVENIYFSFNGINKIILAASPIFLFVLYLIFYIKYWDLEMFKIK